MRACEHCNRCYHDRVLISNTEVRRLFLRMTGKWSSRKEEKAQRRLSAGDYAKLCAYTGPNAKYSFLRCLVPKSMPNNEHLVQTGPVADVATAVAKDQAPIAGGLVKNYVRMRPIFLCVTIVLHSKNNVLRRVLIIFCEFVLLCACDILGISSPFMSDKCKCVFCLLACFLQVPRCWEETNF